MISFNPSFRHLLKDRGLTYLELAELTSINRNTLRNLDGGKGNIQNLIKIMDTMNWEIVGRGLPGGNDLGGRILQLRERKQISQSFIADTIGVTRQTISNMERHSIGRLCTLANVFKHLGVKAKVAPSEQTKRFTEHSANTSTSDEWYTPPHILQALYEVIGGPFDLDPCSPTRENVKAPVWAYNYYTKKNDGLSLPWNGKVFMNPPYSQIAKWTAKAKEEFTSGRAKTVIGLVPARTDTKWWNENCFGQAEILFLKGRLKFGSMTNSAPFPSAVITWSTDNKIAYSLSKIIDGALVHKK